MAHYTRALGIAERRGVGATRESSVREPPLQHLYTSRGRALELNGQHDEALRNYDEMEALERDLRSSL